MRCYMHATMTEYDRTEGKGDAGNNYLCKVHAVNIGYQYPHVTINNTLYHVAGKQPSYLILLNSKWSKCRAPLVTPPRERMWNSISAPLSLGLVARLALVRRRHSASAGSLPDRSCPIRLVWLIGRMIAHDTCMVVEPLLELAA